MLILAFFLGERMRTALAGVSALPQGCMAELYSVTQRSPDGTTTLTPIYFTNADVDIVWNGHTYLAGVYVTQRGDISISEGIGVDTCDLTIANHTYQDGSTLSQLVLNGGLDLAYVTIHRARHDYTVWLFEGIVTDTKPTRTEVVLTISDPKVLLNVQMPRNCYTVGCKNNLYGEACTLVKSSWLSSGAITAVTSDIEFTSSSLTQAAGYFELGQLDYYGTGSTIIESRTVKYFASGVITLAYPLSVIPEIGDTFDIYPGCNKTISICETKFTNKAHFRGEPWMPVPEEAV